MDNEELKVQEPVPVEETKEVTPEATEDLAKTAENDEMAPTPPPKPARPLSPFSQSQTTLKEAFPSVEPQIIKAVLIAANGNVDQAFNALLAMSDPDYKPDYHSDPNSQRGSSQIEQDEKLARELAGEVNPQAHYSSSSRVRSGFSGRYDDERRSNDRQERSFFDDDLPEIRENLTKGFNETRTKVNSWVENLRKKIDGAAAGNNNNNNNYDDDEDYYTTNNNPSRSQLFGALGNNDRPSSERKSRGNRYYDRDPREINDDFQGISLADNSEDKPTPPPKPPRPSNVVNALGETKPKEDKQWEPIKSSEESAESKDPFFIGESDDEK